MTSNVSIPSAATMTGGSDGHVPNLPPQPSEPPFLLFEESDNKYWGVADRDVPILIGAAAGAVGLVFLILGAVFIWYCCQVFFKQDKKALYSPDLDSEEGSISSFDSYPFSDSQSSGKKKLTRMDSARRSLSAPMDRSMESRRGTMEEQDVFTSNLYKNRTSAYKNRTSAYKNRTSAYKNRTSAYPAVIEVNTEDKDKCEKAGRNVDRSHLYHPITVSSMVDEETLALQQLAPSFHHPHSNTEVMKVSSFYQV